MKDLDPESSNTEERVTCRSNLPFLRVERPVTDCSSAYHVMIVWLLISSIGCGFSSSPANERSRLTMRTQTIMRHFKNRQFDQVLPLYARETRAQIDKVEFVERQNSQAIAMTNLGTLIEDNHVVSEKISIDGIHARVPVYLKIRRIKGESTIKVRRFDLTYVKEGGDWMLIEIIPHRGLPE